MNDFAEFLRYEDGKLFWKKHFFRSLVGKEAGYFNNGYRYVRFKNKSYCSHRIIWFLIYGEFPKLIDHINGNRSDNRLENLRSCSYSMNSQNSKYHRNGGPLGIFKRGDKYLVQLPKELLNKNSGSRYLGSFVSLETAKSAINSLK